MVDIFEQFRIKLYSTSNEFIQNICETEKFQETIN